MRPHLIAVLCHLDDHKGADHKVGGGGDLNQHRLAQVKVLVAHDVVNGEEDEGHVDDVEADRGDQQHLAPRIVKKVLAHYVEPDAEEQVSYK